MRESGFYWVKLRGEDSFELARYKFGIWHIVGSDENYLDKDFETIEETQIKHYVR